jgi:tetratricopeptide (TPR) repeat protein
VFDDVRICTDTLRYDSANTFATHFTKADVRVLCDRYGVEGIIALDKFSCRTRYEEANGYAYQRGDYINVIIDLELRAMWEGQLTPASIELADTLRWHYAYDWYMMDGYRRERLINIKRAMHRLADYMGHNAQGNFVPWWTNSHRHYYIAYSSVWRRATAYADAERWNEAEEVWNYLLANTKNGLKKAKLLSNIALCLEIKGDIKSALTNAERSYTLFRENKGEEYMLTKAQKQYVETIKGRLANEEILVRQLHEE